VFIYTSTVIYLLFLLFYLIPHVIQYILNFVVIDFVLFLYLINIRGPSWLWSYCSWIYNN